MIILDSTRKLQIVLSGAITTNQLSYTASYADHDATTPAFTPAASDGTTNSTTAVDMVAAPASGVQRQVKTISVYNSDTVQATVTLRLVSGANNRNLFVATIQAGESIQYEEGEGFSVYNTFGARKNTNTSVTVSSGTYAPSTVATTNVTSVAYSNFFYTVTGNVITVFGRLDVQPTTSSTATEVVMTVPVLMNNSYSAAGSGRYGSSTVVGVLNPTTAISAVRVQFVSPGTTTMASTISFAYVAA